MKKPDKNEYEWEANRYRRLIHRPTKAPYYLINGKAQVDEANWYRGAEKTPLKDVSDEYDMEAVREMAEELVKERR
jgi:hypothetical protein